VACRAVRDENGTTYFVPAAKVLKTPGGKALPGIPEIQVWWMRNFKARAGETLLIRQENNPKGADVIELTLGQVYDLIHALSNAVMRP
jgi:hypothetical protein